MIQLPQKFAERMKVLLGDEYESYVESLNKAPVRAFRVNTDKISLSDFEKVNPFNTEKIPYVENGFYFTDEKYCNYFYSYLYCTHQRKLRISYS